MRRAARLAALGAGLAGLTGLARWAYPREVFPDPGGPFHVGTTRIDLRDTTRPQTLGPRPRGSRELVVQLTYPTRAVEGLRATWVDDVRVLDALAALLRLPPLVLRPFASLCTSAIVDAPFAPDLGRAPLVLFSHGRGGFRQHNTRSVHLLASQGYVVAAVDHPYAASGVRLGDGRFVSLDAAMTRDEGPEGVAAQIPHLARDLAFVLTHLLGGSALAEHLDPDRVGAFGVSMGAETVAELHRVDARVCAALMLDAWMPPEVAAHGFDRPAMIVVREVAAMRRERWTEDAIARTRTSTRAAFERSRGQVELVHVARLFHADFSDAPWLSPLIRLLGVSAGIPRAELVAIVDGLLLRFFDTRVRDRSMAPIAPSIPGVRIERREGGR